MTPTAYNEYKYLVSSENLSFVQNILEDLYGSTDDFPQGVVDSIYYDTLTQSSYLQCLHGDPIKSKFRIRGYGDGSFNQAHMKYKNLFQVQKIKAKINPLRADEGQAPTWAEVQALLGNESEAAKLALIKAEADQEGPLFPIVRVIYDRRRFRVNDYRVTLDYNIRILPYDNVHGWGYYDVLPQNVLEIKTETPRPHLPLLGLVKLPQISFSKFFLGINHTAVHNNIATGV